MSKTVLVIAAHTDDEALGCGGTIARHVAEGDTVHAVFMADGVTSRPGSTDADQERRMTAAAQAHRILGLDQVEYLGFPDNRMDSQPLLDVVQRLEIIVRSLAPQVIYTHHHGDLNIDHRITHQAVMTVCRPVPGSSIREIYAFEVMSSSEWGGPEQVLFQPNYFVDISNYLDAKLKALVSYRHEMRDFPHSRSMGHIENLARHRGCTVGIDAAEGFMLIRKIRMCGHIL